MARGPRRRLWIGAVVAVFALLGVDLLRAPSDQLSARVLLGGIDLYQATVSPLLPRVGAECRFTPTCSHYGEAAIRNKGAFLGSGRAIWRILRCGPWTAAGTADPPPGTNQAPDHEGSQQEISPDE